MNLRQVSAAATTTRNVRGRGMGEIGERKGRMGE